MVNHIFYAFVSKGSMPFLRAEGNGRSKKDFCRDIHIKEPQCIRPSHGSTSGGISSCGLVVLTQTANTCSITERGGAVTICSAHGLFKSARENSS